MAIAVPLGGSRRESAVAQLFTFGANSPTAMNSPQDGSEEVWKLFHMQVPELASGVVEIKAMARKRGARCMLAVSSTDPRIDPVGSCAGERGVRAKSVVQQLSGEHIDIVRWSESYDEFIRNALAPLVIREIMWDKAGRRATISVGSTGHSINPVRLSLICRVTGFEIKIVEV